MCAMDGCENPGTVARPAGRDDAPGNSPDAVQGVVVLGDFLRPDAQGRPGGTDRPTRWLFNAVRGQIAVAAALPTALLTPSDDAELAAWLATQRSAAAADAFWAAHFAALPWSPALERLVLARLAGRFCLTYEAPPYLLRLLDDIGVSWLDLRIHPVRFLDDLIFAVRAADATTQLALFARAVPESVVVATAGLCVAMGQFISDAAVPEDTLIVVGQRPLDATQIVDGRFFDAAEHVAEVERICRAHRAVVLKPHPSGDAHSLLLAAAGSGGNVLGSIRDNLYRMLALPQVGAVLTVNSSIASEAPYFGKRVHTLAPPSFRFAWRGAADPALYASLDAQVLMPDFWRVVLAPHAPVSAADGATLPAKPNRLRIALDSFWNFYEIDTDRIPRAAG
jgi:hypothetical protein